MSDAEKAAADLAAGSQALTDAVTRAETAEAALIRYKIAVDLELSKEDVTVLDGVQGDEKTLRALAERLAGRKSPAPKPTPTQGRTTGGTPARRTPSSKRWTGSSTDLSRKGPPVTLASPLHERA
ncbi:hypothetical protein [Promicromonospora kroppenstedtii]|uniref:hypothetical protein n=1 Tax=Promicromonospora kroppenstedtii TaxID=440482 RepID=UPI0004AD27AE|nr:hypothetical protein [Promicromonospora kroppenstedtii]